jgi:tRNA(Ile)-lysidine synthase TilS/MesJ
MDVRYSVAPLMAQVGTRNNCTFCGVFRRQALDRGAQLMKADKVGRMCNIVMAEKVRGT